MYLNPASILAWWWLYIAETCRRTKKTDNYHFIIKIFVFTDWLIYYYNEFLLLIKSQFKTDAQNTLRMNQYNYGRGWPWTVAPFRRFKGGCGWNYRHQKCVREVSLHFQVESNTLGSLSTLTDKNLKDWIQHAVGSCAKSCLRTVCLYILCRLNICVVIHSVRCVH